jgi:hypothetical protein
MAKPVSRIAIGLLLGAALCALSSSASAGPAMDQLCTAAGQGAGCIQPMRPSSSYPAMAPAPYPGMNDAAIGAAGALGNALGNALIKSMEPAPPPPTLPPPTVDSTASVRFDELSNQDPGLVQQQDEDARARARAAAKKLECQAQSKVDQDQKAIEELGFENGTRELEEWEDMSKEQKAEIEKVRNDLLFESLVKGTEAHLEWLSSFNIAKEKGLEGKITAQLGEHFPGHDEVFRQLHRIALEKDKRKKLEAFRSFVEFADQLKDLKDHADLAKDIVNTTDPGEQAQSSLEAAITVFQDLNPESPAGEMASKAMDLGKVAIPLGAAIAMDFSGHIDELDQGVEARLKQLGSTDPARLSGEVATLKQDVAALKAAKRSWASASAGAPVPCLPARQPKPLILDTKYLAADNHSSVPDAAVSISNGTFNSAELHPTQ